jgi:hypothetical protein
VTTKRDVRVFGFAVLASAALALSTCGGKSRDGLGEIRLTLTASANGHTYRLRNAVFDVNGPVRVTLNSETDPTAADLVTQVPPGSYVVTLADGWALEREDSTGPVVVQATLTSANPTPPVTVQANQTTSVTFQFSTNGMPITTGQTGTIDISIGVTEVTDGGAPQLDLAVDTPDIATELGTTASFGVTLSASNGFAGTVNLAASVVSPTGMALPGWSITLDSTEVDVAKDGTAVVHATVVIPSLNNGLAAIATVTATSGATAGNHAAPRRRPSPCRTSSHSRSRWRAASASTRRRRPPRSDSERPCAG